MELQRELKKEGRQGSADNGNEKRKKRLKRKLNAVDAFLLLALLALLFTPAARLFYGRLEGLRYADRAVVNFRIERTAAEAVSALRDGDSLFLEETGAPLGTLLTVSSTLSRDGMFASGNGSLELYGADTESGFRTRDGIFAIPYQSYTVTGGRSTVTVTILSVELLSGNGGES